MILCATAAVICFANWFRTQQSKWLVRLLVCCVAAVGIFVVERLIVTEGEQIEANIHALVHAFQKQDQKLTHSFISDDPRSRWIHEMIDKGFQWVEVRDGVRVTDVTFKVDGQKAESTFRANATLVLKSGSHQGSIGHQPSRWQMDWAKEGSDWKVVAVRRLHVLDGRELEVFHEG